MAETLSTIQGLGCKVGITLNPGTGADMIEPFLSLADLVLVMTVQPGFSGQSFMPEVLPKIGQIREAIDRIKPEVLLEVDGGINPDTIRSTYDQGANVFVAASAIFKHPSGIQAGVDSLLEQLPG
jgi:ribulose-phosphate 3-epimerase